MLDDFNLHLKPGRDGRDGRPHGSGKTTVSRLLPRFYDVDAGSVRIDGIDVRELTLESLRAQIGVVLDEPFLFSVSIRDNIAYGRPDAPLEEIEAAARAAGADEFIDQLADGYDTVVGERGYTLSGGQRQRVAIARTLLVNPPILVLDDATSAVDVQVEQEIHEALRTLMEGRTTLIVAHRLSTIGLADRVVLLDGGRIVADGTHAELLRDDAAVRRGARPGRGARSRLAMPSRSSSRLTGDDPMSFGGGSAAARRCSAPPAGRGPLRRPAAVCRSPVSRPSSRRASTSCSPSEPDHGEPTAVFSHRAVDADGARLTLRALILRHWRLAARGGAAAGRSLSVANQAGPALIRYGIDHGMLPGHHDFNVVLVAGLLFLLAVVDRRAVPSAALPGSPAGSRRG